MSSIQNVTFVLLALGYIAIVSAGSCLEKAESYSQFESAKDVCMSTLNLTTADISTGKELKENDKCLSKCTLESLGMFSNGTIHADVMLEIFRNETASDVYPKIEKIVEKCLEKANKHEKKDKEPKEKKMKGTSEPTVRIHTHPHQRKNGTCACGKAARFVYCVKEKDLEATC